MSSMRLMLKSAIGRSSQKSEWPGRSRAIHTSAWPRGVWGHAYAKQFPNALDVQTRFCVRPRTGRSGRAGKPVTQPLAEVPAQGRIAGEAAVQRLDDVRAEPRP